MSHTVGVVFEVEKDNIRQFVVRARRVVAHSLVRDWERLVDLTEDRFIMRLNLAGSATMTLRLPENEEVFESLVARLRPILLTSEPVHHGRVFKAIKRLVVQGGPGFGAEHRDHFDRLRARWQQLAGDTPRMQTYAMQGFDERGQPVTPLVPDAALAGGWLYADLVHAEPLRGLENSLHFSLAERYVAAVRLFSNIAALTAHTLAFINRLRDDGLIDIDSSAWTTPVAVNSSELVQHASVFVAPAGTVGPAWVPGSLQVAEGWRPLTITQATRFNAGDRVDIVLRDAAGEVITTHEAAVVYRDTAALEWHWRVLVDDAIQFSFVFEISGDTAIPRHAHWQVHRDTNRQLLASSHFLLQMHTAAEVSFEAHHHRFVVFTTEAPETTLLELRALTDLALDLTIIENQLGQALGVCDGDFDQSDQVMVRVIRLLYEGQVVPFRSTALQVPIDSNTLPLLLGQRPGIFTLGSCQIPVPAFYIYHPQASVRDLSSAEPREQRRIVEYAPPAGERLLAWSPDCGAPAAEPNRLSTTADWGIPDIDQRTFPW
jgi:hypothetical protein